MFHEGTNGTANITIQPILFGDYPPLKEIAKGIVLKRY
jgi:hypothetical protein